MTVRDFATRLPEKLKVIREHYNLAPDHMATYVKARDGNAVTAYENGEDMPVSVLLAYARLSGIPVENLVDDDRDLWFGHRVN